MTRPTISVVTPTFLRPDEVAGLLGNIALQTLLPAEVILVDGAPSNQDATETLVRSLSASYPFEIKYIRYGGGTAIQRNRGIDAAKGEFIAFIDDDVRLDTEFLRTILDVFEKDGDRDVGGVVGYRSNEYFDANMSERWRWYRDLKLLTVFEPGRYDFECGYPINNSMQPPFSGTRDVDFMTTACAVWRREVFDSGLRFDEFFRDYGVLEDAHLSLRAARRWKLLQCGDASCEELRSPNGRASRRKLGFKSVANYYYVFHEVAGPLTLRREFRFWLFQSFEVFRISLSAVRRRRWGDVMELIGKCEGAFSVAFRRRRWSQDSAAVTGEYLN